MAKKRKAKKKRERKIRLPALKKKADRIISLYVRGRAMKEYGYCPLCVDDRKSHGLDPSPVQCCFHFISRRRTVLRWREDNLVGACHLCNYWENYFPDSSRAWYIRKFGHEKYLSLVDEAKKPFEPTREYLEGLITEYAKKLDDLSKTTNIAGGEVLEKGGENGGLLGMDSRN